ncbi:MAG: tetratricopeptide repeat protein [Acidobacteria bacterium]|nr:tetratricopeptide repeat protein [Acidobacteriota bacterium]
MRQKLFIIAGIIFVSFALVVGLNGFLKRRPVVVAKDSPIIRADETTSDGQIQKAEAIIKRAPERPEGYNLLAAAYLRKARETGDFSLNAKAEAALNRSLALAVDDFDTLRLQATLLLTYHRFQEALEVARRAQALRPDDADVYGAMTDALVELGDYRGAIEAAQKMVDLRPDTASYSRVSYLRELHGDTSGAIEAMRVAAGAADPRSPESAAWCRVQLGLQLINAGRRAEAEREFDAALAVFPNYFMALAAKARARVSAGDLDGALELYGKAQERVPLPETVIARGDLLSRLGRADEAKREYELAEFIERTGANAGTYSRQLALLLADREEKLDEALAIARRERESRSDIYTCDALAWCLYKKGLLREADAAMNEALRLGTRDARLFYHAGLIAKGLGDQRRARKYLQLALGTDPSFNVLQAEDARRLLA